MTRATTQTQVRWLIRRDLDAVLDIEAASFAVPWTREDFLCCLRQRNCIGMVAEHQECIDGFMVYELLKDSLHVLNFAVRPFCRREGVGTMMVDKLKSKLSQQRRSAITLETRDGNLQSHLFWRAQGFKAVRVLRGFYEDTGEDAYRFRYHIAGEHP